MVTVTDRPRAFCDAERAVLRRERIRQAVKAARIAVLMGGDTGEREVSLRSGAGVAAALRAETDAIVTPVDVRYERLPAVDLRADFDLAYNTLHGGRGEDGTIQGFLECVGLPYTGPGVLGCAIAMDKLVASRLLAEACLPVPSFAPFDASLPGRELAPEIVDELGLPVVVKPRNEGSSLGVRFCHNEAQLGVALEAVQGRWGGGLACELIPEPEVTIGVVQGHALPVLELVPRNEFYDYEAKYTKGLTEFILPARLDEPTYARCLEVAGQAAAALACEQLCRVDVRIDAEGEPRILDVNASPGMTETSDLPAEAEHIGLSYGELVLEVLGSALVRWGRMSPEEWR